MKKIILLIILISLVIVGCQSQSEPEETGDILYPEATITLVDLEGNQLEVTLEELVDYGEVNFVAKKDTSTSDPIEYDYTGILLKDVFEEMEISIEGISGVVVSALDGYKVTIAAEKIEQDDNVYLTYKKEGQWLENKENGGSGPIQLIVSNDQFSQYWCKYVTSIELIE